MRLVKRIFLTVILVFITSNAFAQNGVNEGRKIIKSLEKELHEFLSFSDYELRTKTPEFRADYKKTVLTRLNNISKNISPNAIKWVDIDHDGNPELIFWTEGLAGDVEGVKEFLFVASVGKNDKFTKNKKVNNRLLLIRQLNPEPSKSSKEYEYSKFMPYPNIGRGYNNFLCAVFSYGTFGVNATNFINYEIFWNKYHNKIDISEFFTSFPVAVEKSENNESWEKSPITNSK
jgi:hypothetical protein